MLSKLAKKLPVFPYVKNQRSMLYVDNLCKFVSLIIKNSDSGIFHPQNSQYSSTSEMVKMIAAVRGKRVILLKGFGWALKALSAFTGLVNKAFGNLTYEKSLSEYKEDYEVCGLEESIKRTEEGS